MKLSARFFLVFAAMIAVAAQAQAATNCEGSGITVVLDPEHSQITFTLPGQSPVVERIAETVDLPQTIENGIPRPGGFAHVTVQGNRFELDSHIQESVVFKGKRYALKCDDPSKEDE